MTVIKFIALFLVIPSMAFAETPSIINVGALTYIPKCSSCHGKEGQGNPAIAKMFAVDVSKLNLTKSSEKKKEDLIQVVTNGRNKMPKFEGKITPQQIQWVVDYIQTFK